MIFLKSLGLFLSFGFDLLTWACSPGKTQEGRKMPRSGLWVQEKPRPWSRSSSISSRMSPTWLNEKPWLFRHENRTLENFQNPTQHFSQPLASLYNKKIRIINLNIKFYLNINQVPGFIFTNGIFFEFMKNNFNKIICTSFIIIGQFFLIINLYGLCAQFVFRYLILNR